MSLGHSRIPATLRSQRCVYSTFVRHQASSSKSGKGSEKLTTFREELDTQELDSDFDLDEAAFSRKFATRELLDQKSIDDMQYERESLADGYRKVKVNGEWVYEYEDDSIHHREYTEADYRKAFLKTVKEERLERIFNGEVMEDVDREYEARFQATLLGKEWKVQEVEHHKEFELLDAMEEEGGVMFGEHDDNMVDDDDDVDDAYAHFANTPGTSKLTLEQRILKSKRKQFSPEEHAFKKTVMNSIYRKDYASAVEQIFKRHLDTTSERIPRRMIAAFLNILIPNVPHILGLPIHKCAFASGAVDLCYKLMRIAFENKYIFSDVEWRHLLKSIANDVTPDNAEDVKLKLQAFLKILQSSYVFQGHTSFRFKSNHIAVTQNSRKRLVKMQAPDIRIIESEVWLAYYSELKHPLAFLYFRKIHDASVVHSKGKDVSAYPYESRAYKHQLNQQEQDAEPLLYGDVKHEEKYIYGKLLDEAYKSHNWVSYRSHPDLSQFLDLKTYKGFMSASTDIQNNPILFQAPDMASICYPRISMDLRQDQTALFPAAMRLMSMVCNSGTGNVEQAEILYKYMCKTVLNTEKYYHHIHKQLKLIEKYRESHDYNPKMDYDMAQGQEVPEGEEFRYYAGLDYPTQKGQVAYRNRVISFLSNMSEKLVKLYKIEKRPQAIENLLTYMYEKHKQLPLVFPLPSMHIVQYFIDSCIESHNIARTRKWLATLENIYIKLPITPFDPLLQTVLRRFKDKREYLEGRDDEAFPGVPVTHNRIMKKTIRQDSIKYANLVERNQQLKFHSLRIEMQAHIMLAKAALAGATNDFKVLAQLINEDLENINFPAKYRARVYSMVFKRLFHSSRTNRNDQSVGSQVYGEYNKYLESILQEDTPTIVEKSNIYLNTLLEPKPLQPISTLQLLTPGHFLYMLHAAQRQGVAITSTMMSNVLGILALFPDILGNYASFMVLKNITTLLGENVNLEVYNRLLEACGMQGQLAFKYIDKKGKKQADDLGSKPSKENMRFKPAFQNNSDPYHATRQVQLLHPMYNWLQPQNVFELIYKHKLIPDNASYKYALMYYTLQQDWKNANVYYKAALDQCYYGNYEYFKHKCKLEGVKLSDITNELPFEQRLLAKEVRLTMLVRASAVQNRSMVKRICKDIELSEDITLHVSKKTDLDNVHYKKEDTSVFESMDVSTKAMINTFIARYKGGLHYYSSRHVRLHNTPQLLVKIHNMLLYCMEREDGQDFIEHRKFMELAGVEPNIETFLKALYVGVKQAVYPNNIDASVSLQEKKSMRSAYIMDALGSESRPSRSMVILPSTATCMRGVPLEIEGMTSFFSTFQGTKELENINIQNIPYKASELNSKLEEGYVELKTCVKEFYPPSQLASEEELETYLETRMEYIALDFPKNERIPYSLMQLHEQEEDADATALSYGAEHIDMLLQEMLVRNIPLLPRVFGHIVDKFVRSNTHCGLMATPYIYILLELLPSLPIIDYKARVVHEKGGLMDMSNGSVVMEEELGVNALGETLTMNKLTGKHVMYQHEAINMSFSVIQVLLSQQSVLLDKASKNKQDYVLLLQTQRAITVLLDKLLPVLPVNTEKPGLFDHQNKFSVKPGNFSEQSKRMVHSQKLKDMTKNIFEVVSKAVSTDVRVEEGYRGLSSKDVENLCLVAERYGSSADFTQVMQLYKDSLVKACNVHDHVELKNGMMVALKPSPAFVAYLTAKKTQYADIPVILDILKTFPDQFLTIMNVLPKEHAVATKTPEWVAVEKACESVQDFTDQAAKLLSGIRVHDDYLASILKVPAFQ